VSLTSEDYFAPNLSATGRRFAIVVSRFNRDITEALLEGALTTLLSAGATESDIDVIWVPGAFELPAAAAQVVGRTTHDAVLALGCVIRGGTPHFDYVAGEAARGLSELGRSAAIPVVFGVLTTDNTEQAEARAGGDHGNKGEDAAKAAMEMIDVYHRIGGLS